MIDFFNIPDNSLNSQVFYTKGSTDWQIWKKPANCKMVMILCLGSGGGGGAGQNAAVSTTRRGGGGGGSAGYSVGFFSSVQIPDTLFLQVAPGGSPGIGGSTSSNGSAGGTSYVSIQPNTTAINILLQSNASATPAGPGFQGGGTGAGAGGSAAAIWNGSILNDLGFAVAYAGQTGSAGQTNATPIAITPSGIVTSGAGGAGTNLSVVFNGGEITGSGFYPTMQGGVGSSSGLASSGSSFFSLNTSTNSNVRLPMFFMGGSGGGSSNSATGGNGGNASFGSGGGGGGVGVTGQAGNGGSGGDGIIIITCY